MAKEIDFQDTDTTYKFKDGDKAWLVDALELVSSLQKCGAKDNVSREQMIDAVRGVVRPDCNGLSEDRMFAIGARIMRDLERSGNA